MTRTGLALGLLVAMVVVSTGCGGGGSSATKTAAATTTPSTTRVKKQPAEPKRGSWGAVFGAESEDTGIILFDLSGHALYRFDGDRGSMSSCYGPCAKRWPPALTEGEIRAVDVPRKMVGTAKRRDGTVQLTYDGHPLYTHSGDGQGEANGNGVKAFGARWHALRPSGQDASG